jgi:hypothetical protein
MGRIRTIKPEFFTSEDIVGLSAMARLLYIALWCEADREGRMVWKPTTFKLRYLPADDCDIKALCQEILDAGLIALYGDGYAYIPAFKAHQHINPRESATQLPDPDASGTREARVATRQPRDSDAQGGKERKGKEGIEDASPRDASVPPGFAAFWQAWPSSDRKQAKGECLKAWKKARAEPDAAQVVAHVERLKTTVWMRDNGAYIPAPLVYLNQRRWEGADEGRSSDDRTVTESFI